MKGSEIQKMLVTSQITMPKGGENPVNKLETIANGRIDLERSHRNFEKIITEVMNSVEEFIIKQSRLKKEGEK